MQTTETFSLPPYKCVHYKKIITKMYKHIKLMKQNYRIQILPKKSILIILLDIMDKNKYSVHKIHINIRPNHQPKINLDT